LLAERGWQVIDLEEMANHRGSALGARAGGQPTQKLFEGRLAGILARLDPARPVVIEAESNKVGQRIVPPSLWQAMRAAPVVEVTAPLAARARYLAQAYADIAEAPEDLRQRLERLRPLRGHAAVDAWQALARDGSVTELAAQLIQHHYDPGYAKVRRRHHVQPRAGVYLEDLTGAALHRALPRLEAALRAAAGC
jgi:tRNA 2-selenouridine synthase